MTDDDLLSLTHDQDSTEFNVVMRGYDRREVNDYLERYDVILADAERLHAEDGARLAVLEREVAILQGRVVEAEEHAAGLPEPASRIGERLATMLRLAEEEAEQIVTQARERAAASSSERSAELDAREALLDGRKDEADQLRMDAQRDAESVRSQAQQEVQDLRTSTREQVDSDVARAREEAERLVSTAREQADAKRKTAEEDISILHEQARGQATERLADSQRAVDDLQQQYDTINAQMDALQQTLSAVVRPPGTPPTVA